MALHRTFVKLDTYEKEIVQGVRKMLRRPNGKLPPQSDAIRAIIRDYWALLEDIRANLPPESDEITGS